MCSLPHFKICQAVPLIFLLGTGLQTQTHQRYVPVCSELSLGFSSSLKFQWKIFNGSSRSGVIKSNKTAQPDLSSLAVKTADDSELVVFSLEAIKGNSGRFCNDLTTLKLTLGTLIRKVWQKPENLRGKKPIKNRFFFLINRFYQGFY